MPRLSLSFVSAYNERVQPLMDGSIQAEGVELIPTYSDPSETFWRQLKFHEFEISEMSLSSYLIARSRGMDFIAIPVFPARRFFSCRAFLPCRFGNQATERCDWPSNWRRRIPANRFALGARHLGA